MYIANGYSRQTRIFHQNVVSLIFYIVAEPSPAINRRSVMVLTSSTSASNALSLFWRFLDPFFLIYYVWLPHSFGHRSLIGFHMHACEDAIHALEGNHNNPTVQKCYNPPNKHSSLTMLSLSSSHMIRTEQVWPTGGPPASTD